MSAIGHAQPGRWSRPGLRIIRTVYKLAMVDGSMGAWCYAMGCGFVFRSVNWLVVVLVGVHGECLLASCYVFAYCLFDLFTMYRLWGKIFNWLACLFVEFF